MEPRVSFDGQASTYEYRAGLPEAICREVAAQLLDGLRASAVVVDVGAGTGTLGRHLAGARYLGIDVSRGMLEEFLRSLGSRRGALLLHADADRAWPIRDRAADLILFSRSAHLLKGEHALGEVLRIAAPGCRIFVGRVRRPRESPAEQLKRTMQQMLREREVPGKNGERAKRDFLEALERHGARLLPERVSSSWNEDEAPIESIRSWRGKAGLAGRLISDEMKREILAELEAWAADRLGDLAAKQPVARHYQLEGAQLAE